MNDGHCGKGLVPQKGFHLQTACGLGGVIQAGTLLVQVQATEVVFCLFHKHMHVCLYMFILSHSRNYDLPRFARVK